ncbi:MAG: NmrA/HSCARG family protein [Chloroflexi bacterium]|nr:NmrA/HSCARG family protein [Chloroflexota bacterium]
MTQAQRRLILVTGATGRQGGAVVQTLLAAGVWRVRALTRNPESEEAKALKGRGVEVVRGDMDSPATLDAALGGAYGVFSVQVAMGQGGPQEIQQGKNVADAAKRARVQHLVYTSVCGAERPTGIPHFESKGDIEAHIRTLGIPYTIVRPVSFLDNFQRNRDAILQGRLMGVLAPTTKNWFIAVPDIGAFVAAAFLRPADFLGQAINIAGEEMTMAQVAESFSRTLGRPVAYAQMSPEEGRSRLSPEMLAMNAWYEREGYRVDVPALRARWGIPLMNLEQWTRAMGWTAPRP